MPPKQATVRLFESLKQLRFPWNRRRLTGAVRIAFSFFGLLLVVALFGGLLIETRPGLAAEIADRARDLVGPRPVAQAEAFVFKLQDVFQQWRYRDQAVGVRAPWSTTPILQTGSNHGTGLLPSSGRGQAPSPSASVAAPQANASQQRYPTPSPAADQRARPDRSAAWPPPAVLPFGGLEGEGVWSDYLFNPDQNTVAMRTLLQPDPDRPYTLLAVVAFDLTRSRLHFVLGTHEPGLPQGPRGEGRIPETDRAPGRLLATFNGAFRGVNGQFGALAQGITALPARDDFATLVIYADGALRIGEWGRDFEFEPEMDALRQNCRLIIDAGRISERVYNDSVFDWGAAVSGEIVTLRSAIGLDAARQVLYYFAGTSLSMPVLARAMEAVGVEYGMLLDINHYWVLFNAHRPSEEGLTSEPLYPEVMKEAVDRYLGTSARDFFYLTSIDEPVP